MTTTHAATAALPTGQIWLRGVLAAVIATVLNVAVATIEVSAFSLSDKQISLQPGPLVGFTVIGILVGTGIFVLLRRRGPQGERLFIVVAVIVAVLSLLLPVLMMINPDAFPGGSAKGGAALIPIHLIAATTAITALTVRLARSPKVAAAS